MTVAESLKTHRFPKRILRAAAAFLIPFSMLLSFEAIILRAQETKRAETVAPGIDHIRLRRIDPAGQAGENRWVINALVLDPSRTHLALGLAMDEGVGTETTSSIAARRGALAAVNGGYFRTAGIYRGEPAGLLSVGDKVLSEPYRRRPALAVKNGDDGLEIRFSHYDFVADIVINGEESHPISGINRPRLDNELILYTPEFHSTTLTNSYGVEAVVIDGTVISSEAGAGSQRIPSLGYVLSGNGKAEHWAREYLRSGAAVEIRIRMSTSPPLAFDPDFILGGGPILLKEGIPAADSDPGIYAEDFSRNRHPRTAAGIRKDGFIVLVTVDGRRPSSSVGMTVGEITDLMREFGCTEAINLDGGGSTSMVIRDEVVNNPSDPTGERPVGNALLVFARH